MAFYSDVFDGKKVTDTKIERFICGVYYVDIIEKPQGFEAWLMHKDFGVSVLMFGMSKENLRGIVRGDFLSDKQEAQFVKRLFLACVSDNLLEHIEQYNAEYVDKSEG